MLAHRQLHSNTPAGDLIALLPATARALICLPCPHCGRPWGYWSGRWRVCGDCGSSWRYGRELTDQLMESA